MADHGFKHKQNGKIYTKAPHSSYFVLKAPEEIPLEFDYKIMWLNFFSFLLFLHKQDWLECLSKVRRNKN